MSSLPSLLTSSPSYALLGTDRIRRRRSVARKTPCAYDSPAQQRDVGIGDDDVYRELDVERHFAQRDDPLGLLFIHDDEIVRVSRIFAGGLEIAVGMDAFEAGTVE